MSDKISEALETSFEAKKPEEVKKELMQSRKEVKVDMDDSEKDYNKLWKMVWRNIREENPSMRLTKGGYQFLKNSLELKDYMVKLKRECKLKPEILLGLDKFITCPYYITNKEIYVFEEKLASELVLRAGDLDILIVSRR